MPELPEVEAVCRKLRPAVEGTQIRGVRVSRCATAQVEELVPGRKIERVERRGKHILLRLSGGITVHTHLRMSGNLFHIPDYRFHSHSARVVMELSGGAGIVLEDKRVLARMDALPDAVIDARLGRELGPEPLSAEFTEDSFLIAARRSRQPAKLFLMNQRNVAGLGNIYAAEALYRARVDPRRAMNEVSGRKLRALYGAIVTVLTDAVKSAVAAYSGPGAFHSEENFPMAVYGREGEACLSCRRPVVRIPQGGRSTYFCPRCQR
jgi:formamidopyrimidine-DNA glycosylase